MKFVLKDNQLAIVAEVNDNPPTSSTGKTRLLVSTGGFVTAPGITYNGQPVKINLTVTIPNNGAK